MTRLLSKSESWIVIREDNEGVHIHTPKADHLALLAVILKGDPELFKVITSLVNDESPEDFNISLN
jgi:hypothetical protein